jgi:hypothetical protein
MFAIVVTDTWWVVGWPMIIFLAGSALSGQARR